VKDTKNYFLKRRESLRRIAIFFLAILLIFSLLQVVPSNEILRADYGYQWKPANGLYGGSISTVLVDPANPQLLYTGTYGGGVFKSINGGSTWSLVASNLDLADGSFDLDLSTQTIVDPLRCRVRVGIYDPATGAWLTWGTGKQYYDESGHFWVINQ
jgi:hypothetical protein